MPWSTRYREFFGRTSRRAWVLVLSRLWMPGPAWRWPPPSLERRTSQAAYRQFCLLVCCLAQRPRSGTGWLAILPCHSPCCFTHRAFFALQLPCGACSGCCRRCCRRSHSGYTASSALAVLLDAARLLWPGRSRQLDLWTNRSHSGKHQVDGANTSRLRATSAAQSIAYNLQRPKLGPRKLLLNLACGRANIARDTLYASSRGWAAGGRREVCARGSQPRVLFGNNVNAAVLRWRWIILAAAAERRVSSDDLPSGLQIPGSSAADGTAAARPEHPICGYCPCAYSLESH